MRMGSSVMRRPLTVIRRYIPSLKPTASRIFLGMVITPFGCILTIASTGSVCIQNFSFSVILYFLRGDVKCKLDFRRERESRLFFMIEFTPVDISHIPSNFGFRDQLPRRERVDPETGITLSVPDGRRAVALARDKEYQRRLLSLPKPDAEAPIDVFFDAMKQLRNFDEWLTTYPLAKDLTLTEKYAAQEAVLTAIERAAKIA